MHQIPVIRRAFTLVEIMIVVLIIGILMAIAVPQFVNARTTSQLDGCLGNLRQIESAKEQFVSMDSGRTLGYKPTATDLAPYMTPQPLCPSGGVLLIGAWGDDPFFIRV